MSDIFISYASDDRERIMPLVHVLEKTGWSVFWDRTIPISKTWREVIGVEMESFRSMIVVWSKISTKSNWVLEEAEEGKQRRVLFPVLIDDVVQPYGFRSIQAANLIYWDGKPSATEFRRLIADLTMLLGDPPAIVDVAKRKAKEETKQKAEKEDQQKIEEERKRQVEKEAKRKAEEEQKRKEKEAKRKAVEEERKQVAEEAKRIAEEHKGIAGRAPPSRFNRAGAITGAAVGSIQTIIMVNFAEQGTSYIFAVLVLLCWTAAGALTGFSAARMTVSAVGFVIGGSLWTLAFGADGRLFEWNGFWWFMLGGAMGAAAASMLSRALGGRPA